ncbi:MFS transporter [Adhaeribacter aerolatus]|nr:MFS transporter [Adhaeribacter aerolatus]
MSSTLPNTTTRRQVPLSEMFRALQYKNYRLFFSGQGISLIGTWMQQIAMSWLVYRLTDSVFLLGILGFASQIPSFLLGPFAGVVSDRFNRHRILIFTQALSMVQASVLATLVLTERATTTWLIGLSVFLGIVNAFDVSARQAFVVSLIPKREDVSNAIALNSSMFNMARLVGPSIAGILIAAVGEGMCFLINAISYVAVILSLLLIKVTPFVQSKKDAQIWRSLKEGFGYAFGFPPIRAIILLIALISLFGMPFSVLMPVFARDILHGGANTLGYLMGASGIGALLGALYLAQRSSVIGLGKIIIGATLLMSVGLICFSFTQSLWLALIFIFMTGLGMIVQMAANNTILQTIVDDDKRGRVMSFYSMAFMGMAPFGSLIAGAVADRIGVAYTFLGCGIMCFLSIIPFAIQLPNLRKMVRPIYERLGILPQVATGLQSATALTTPPEDQ